MAIPSLTTLASNKCIQYCNLISDVGTAPYHLMEPILKRKSAKSLKLIEAKSPQIAYYSDRIWSLLIQRDFTERPTEIKVKTKALKGRQLYEKYEKELTNQRLQVTSNVKQMQRELNKRKNKVQVKKITQLPVKRVSKPAYSSSSSATRPIFKTPMLERARMMNRSRVRNFKR